MIANIINTVINKLINSNYEVLNRLGLTMHINYEMLTNGKRLISAPFDYGFSDQMNNILVEMSHIMNGGYCGNKDYLFERMKYLINQGLMHKVSALTSHTISVNNKPLEQIRPRNRKGQFTSKRSASRRKKK
jgi:hypothetical protein